MMENTRLFEQLEEYSRTLEARVEEQTHQLECEIRERQQTEATLRSSEERWQLVLQGNNDGIWDWDILTNQTFRSTRWFEITGYSEHELSSSNDEWLRLLHPDDIGRVLDTLQAYLQRHTSHFSEEYRLRCKNGNYKWLQDRGQAVWNEAGSPVRMVGSVVDITERKQAESDLQARQERLQRQQEALIDLARVKAFYEGDLETAVQVITQTSGRTLGVERVGVWLLDEDRTCLRLLEQYCWNTLRDAAPTEVYAKDFPVYFQALETHDFIIADSIRQDELSQELMQNWLQPSGVKALLDIPIRSGGKVIGVVCHEYCQSTHIWTVDEQNFASHLAYMLSLTIEARDRQRAETALRLSEERWQLALKGNSDGIWDWDLRTNQVFLSPRWKEMLGYADHELPDQLSEWLTRLHPDDLDRVIAIHRAHLEGETSYFTAEFRMLCRDGNYKWILSRGQALWDANGLPIRIVGSHTDISERKQAEENLRLAKLAADTANKAKSQFLANMSHELRTPLTAVLGLAEVLLEEVFGALNAKQHQYVSTIFDSGKHLLDLINDLLDLAKIESGRMELEPATISARLLCEASLAFVREQAQQKEISLNLQISDNIDTFIADERRMKQVLINLLSNAIKFTPMGGSVELQVRADATDEVISLSVTDTGIGIAPGSMHLLFQPFVQLEGSLSRRFAGTGLGLALVRRVVELHGGSITVESELSQGSCFTVTLPWKERSRERHSSLLDTSLLKESDRIKSETDPSGFVPHFSSAQPSFNAHLSPSQTEPTVLSLNFATTVSHPAPLILIVEDHEMNATMLKDYLEFQGLWVVIARTGLEAIQMAEHQPKLILMDIQMPELDGLEAIRCLRSSDRLPNVPILALTSLVMPGDREKCLAAGANEYLTKPLSLKKLMAMIAHYL